MTNERYPVTIDSDAEQSDESEPAASASFVWTDQDYLGAYRASRMLQHRGYDTLVMRDGFLLVSHVFLAGVLLVVQLALVGVKVQNGPIPPVAIAMSLAFALAAGYALFTRWYGFRWMVRRAYRKSAAYNLEMSQRFTSHQVELANRLIQPIRDWSQIDRFVEFKDGFALIGATSLQWLTQRAFAKPDDDAIFGQIAKSRARVYKQVSRDAASSRSVPIQPTLADDSGLS